MLQGYRVTVSEYRVQSYRNNDQVSSLQCFRITGLQRYGILGSQVYRVSGFNIFDISGEISQFEILQFPPYLKVLYKKYSPQIARS